MAEVAVPARFEIETRDIEYLRHGDTACHTHDRCHEDADSHTNADRHHHVDGCRAPYAHTAGVCPAARAQREE